MQNENNSNGRTAHSFGLPKLESDTSLLAGEGIDDAAPSPPTAAPGRVSFHLSTSSPSPPGGSPRMTPRNDTKQGDHHRVKSDESGLFLDGCGRKRILSWDSKDVAEAISEADRVPKAVPSKGNILTVSDITGVSPIEAEAETMILRALEEKKEQPGSVHNLLAGVPDEGIPVFEEPEEVPVKINETGLRRFQAAVNKVRDNNAGTKTKLAGLASAMRLLNEGAAVIDQDTHQSYQSHDQAELIPPSSPTSTSNADDLFQNANVLYRRPSVMENKVDSKLDVEQGDSDSTEGSQDHNDKKTRRNPAASMTTMMRRARSGVKREFQLVKNDFIEPRKTDIRYFLIAMLYLIILLVVVASILFYGVGNPDLGKGGATVSWFLLFLARQVVTFAMAKTTQVFVIDYLSLKKRFTVKVFGPGFALGVVQSKGCPCVVFFWAVYSLMLLSGVNPFAKHWLFYQNAIDMFNESNNAGTITESSMNFSILGSAIFYGVAVAIKRLWLGLYLGRRTYNNYGNKLAKNMDNILLVSEVAALSQRGRLKRQSREHYKKSAQWNAAMSINTIDSVEIQEDDSVCKTETQTAAEQYYGNFSASQRQVISEELGAWEEPEVTIKKPDDASINAILQFRQALTFLDDMYPFSKAFGPADNRNACIESGQKVYGRLLLRQSSGEVLHFNVIAELAINRDGSINNDKMKELVRIFRPDREGNLTQIDFLKSVDKVYKEFRLIQASIQNSGTVDRAFEMMVNYIFFIILACIILFIIRVDPLALVASMSAFIVGFAFMIGGASSKFFEGVLFILVRRPYDIGDRIHVSSPDNDTNGDGSMTWFVEDIGLYSTTARLAATNEVATYNNGSLASSRIINAARSPRASVSIYLKFGVDVSYAKVQLFKRTVERFVKERPREWMSLSAFRASSVEQDLGFVKYTLALQHRESWQNIGAILDSKAEVASFSLEVAKQLGCRYTAPPLPVNLNMNAGQPFYQNTEGDNVDDAGSFDMGAIASMFQKMQK